MKRFLLGAALALAAMAAHAATNLLWITLDVTPQTRHALIEREAAAVGVTVKSLDYPLRTTTLDDAQTHELQRALKTANVVWIDAPHASVEAKLQALVGEAVTRAGKPTTWVPAGEPAAGDRSLRAYLQAGGVANTRAAFVLLQALLTSRAAPDSLPAPALLPQRGLYHPDLPGPQHLVANAQDLKRLAGDRPAVALLLHRYHFVQGATGWVDDWLRRFEKQGLFAYAVFSSHLAGESLAPLMELSGLPGGKPFASVIVNHALLPQAGALQPLFERWGLPVLQTLPYRAGPVADWEASETGLGMSDLPFYFAQPEGAGAIDPLLVVAHGERGREPRLIARQADAVIGKARHLITLQTKPLADKQLVAFVYNYPPGGDHFGASFLNVPRSLESVSQGLLNAGYRVQPLAEAEWISSLKPLIAAYYPSADLRALLAADQAAALG